MKQSILILVAIILGILLPYGNDYVYLIRYSLMIMLFFAFLGINFKWNLLKRTHGYLLIVNIAIPLFLFLVLHPFDETLAILGFVLGICPTAAAAPVVGQFMKTDIPFITTAVLLTNPFVAIFIPFLLPPLLHISTPITPLDVLGPVLMVVGVPLILSFLIKSSSPLLTQFLLRFRMISFLLFLMNVWIGCGKATYFIRYESNDGIQVMISIAVATGIICFFHFFLGAKMAGNGEPLASGLALGRKNTMFGLWLAITFVSPTVAMGPIFYIIFQNLYNTYQIMQVERAEKARTRAH